MLLISCSNSTWLLLSITVTLSPSTTSSVRSGFRGSPIQSFYAGYQGPARTGGEPGSLPEELRHEVGEVVPPVTPDVALFGGGEGVLDVVFGQGIVQRLGTREEAIGFAAGNIEKLQFFIGGGGIGQQVLVLRLHSLGAHAPTGAESTHGVEDVEMVQTDAERLSAAHGEAGDGAVGGDAVELLGEGHDVLQQVVFEGLGIGWLRGRGRGAEIDVLTGAAIGHDDDHGLGLTGGDQVIQDEIGAADGDPAVFGISGAVEQV